MKFQGILPQRKPWVKAMVAILAVCLLFLEVRAGQYIYVPLALLVILACFFQKEHIISEQGVNIRHMLFGWSMDNLWTWEEITTLHIDAKKAQPNVRLHIGKDVTVRTFLMTPADCRGAVALAKAANPKIYVKEM